MTQAKSPALSKQTSTLLTVEGISKEVRDGERVTTILQDVSLSVEPGEKVALVGPSGSGKSTLLHILGLLDTEYRGTVRLAGQSVRDLNDAARATFRNREVGFIFQAYNLLAHLSALDNVLLPGRFSGVRVDKARASELLASVGLAQGMHRKPATLSGGERQRVAIARALYQQPHLVLCDEPTGNLDAETARDIIALFERLRAQGVALVVATHDDAVAAAADRVLRIRGGRLQ